MTSLLLVGHGNMGSALLARWLDMPGDAVSQLDVIAPHHDHSDSNRLRWHRSLDSLPTSMTPDAIVFAVKPPQLAVLLPAYRARFHHYPLYLSVAAGKPLAFYHRHLGEGAAVVRAMPNTPALIGQGVTALCAYPNLPEPLRRLATQFMEAAGKTLWIDETQMDTVTAISGCGPAYGFYFLECLTNAGIQAGLDSDTARFLAVETLAGSCAMANHGQESFAQLRQNVASPGGATEAALRVLMDGTLASLLQKTVSAAKHRAQELAES